MKWTSPTSQVTATAAVLLPVTAVFAMKLLGLGTAGSADVAVPVRAVAAANVTGGALHSTVGLQITDAERHAMHMRSVSAGDNPFHYRPDNGSQTESAAAPDTPGNLKLTALMGGTKPMAVIDNRFVNIDQEVVPGWKLIKIDHAGRAVTLQGANDRLVVIELTAE